MSGVLRDICLLANTVHQGVGDVNDHPVLPGQGVGVDKAAFIEAKVAAEPLFDVNHLLMSQSSISDNLQ